jgi:hypothetical protein
MRFTTHNREAGHSPHIQCLRCTEYAPVLLFDSLPAGIVCRRCHERLITLRREVLRGGND